MLRKSQIWQEMRRRRKRIDHTTDRNAHKSENLNLMVTSAASSLEVG